MLGFIYKITNIKTNHFYIGSTIILKKRWNEHKNDLKTNIHHSVYMQRSYNKHGKDCFTYKIISKCPQEYLVKLEQWFIDNLKPKYNMAKNANRPQLGKKLSKERKLQISEFSKNNLYNLGRKASTETKNLMSYQRKGKKLKEETIKILKNKEINAVLQYNLNGDFLNEYASIQKASETTGVPRQIISHCCRGKQNTGYKYIWKYKNKPKKTTSRKIIDLNTQIVYDSIIQAAEKLNIHRNSISNSLAGKIKSHKNLQYF